MKAFVEFTHENSDTKSSSHAEFKIFIKKWYLTGLFSFYWSICHKAFNVKVEKTSRKRCLKVAPKNAKGKRLFFGQYILYQSLLKNEEIG